jgi:hypothetical protein
MKFIKLPILLSSTSDYSDELLNELASDETESYIYVRPNTILSFRPLVEVETAKEVEDMCLVQVAGRVDELHVTVACQTLIDSLNKL